MKKQLQQVRSSAKVSLDRLWSRGLASVVPSSVTAPSSDSAMAGRGMVWENVAGMCLGKEDRMVTLAVFCSRGFEGWK